MALKFDILVLLKFIPLEFETLGRRINPKKSDVKIYSVGI